ncbi:MAG: DUF3800 domain-containing protein [Gammaproteobacteria bacterium]|nr:DUF3800 domain-containing protein [Gammaproteobacteria bacterium]MBU1615879.1 DUF3800 domain-containing protein [bacterium]
MLIFLDESGDPGFKVGKGSSNVFVIALVIFDDHLEAEETALKIKRLRRELGKDDGFEFKFNKCSRAIRCHFLSTIAECRFRIRALVIRKEKIYGKELRRNKESFYAYAVKMVLKHNNDTIRDAKLKMDGHGERKFRREFLAYLRRELNSPSRKIVSHLRFVDSRGNVLIQLADMIAGAIHRSFSNKVDANIYREIIKKREEDVWIFGR